MPNSSSFDIGNMLNSTLKDVIESEIEENELEELKKIAEDLKQIIVSNADSQFNESQSSIMEHVSNIIIGEPKSNGDGLYSIDLNLPDGTYRPSLNPKNKKGATNIVSLFTHGWKCKKKVPFGMWRGEMVIARKEKDGMSFLDDAIESFNMNYADSGAVAVIGEVFK